MHWSGLRTPTGKGHFGPEQVIISLGYLGADYGPENIVTADLDSDGDWDIILHYVERDPLRAYVVWFEDIDGGRHFGPEQVITSDTRPLDWADSIHPADLDGDGIWMSSWRFRPTLLIARSVGTRTPTVSGILDQSVS